MASPPLSRALADASAALRRAAREAASRGAYSRETDELARLAPLLALAASRCEAEEVRAALDLARYEAEREREEGPTLVSVAPPESLREAVWVEYEEGKEYLAGEAESSGGRSDRRPVTSGEATRSW